MFVSYYLHKVIKFYVSQAKKLSQFFLLSVNISSQGFVSALDSIGSPQGIKCSLQSEWLSSSLIRKKGKLADITATCDSLPLVVTCCTIHRHSLYHSVSFVVNCCTIRFHSLYHSVSFFVNCCTICFHSMYRSSVFL